MTPRTLGVGLLALLFVATASAQQGRTLTPGEIAWPPAAAGGAGTSGVGGIQTVVLVGDPSKPGLYTIRLKAGPNLRIQAHAHRDDRSAVVISGTWYFGYGKQFDERGLEALPPGSFYTEPAGVDHFAMTREEVVIQITGYGPSSTTYVDPANDPARTR